MEGMLFSSWLIDVWCVLLCCVQMRMATTLLVQVTTSLWMVSVGRTGVVATGMCDDCDGVVDDDCCMTWCVVVFDGVYVRAAMTMTRRFTQAVPRRHTVQTLITTAMAFTAQMSR